MTNMVQFLSCEWCLILNPPLPPLPSAANYIDGNHYAFLAKSSDVWHPIRRYMLETFSTDLRF